MSVEDISSTELQCSNIVTSIEALARDMPRVFDPEPTLERLRKGDSPGTTEVSKTFELIQDAHVQLSKYDSFVEKIEESLQKLKQAREELKGSIDVTAAFVSPVRLLPEDVLLEIFALHIASEEVTLGLSRLPEFDGYSLAIVRRGAQIRTHCPTLHLSQICSFWRKIVLSQPTLWRSLAIPPEVVDAKHLEIISHYLFRSASTPLTLLITSNATQRLSSYAQQAFNLLVNCSSTWKSITFHIGGEMEILLSRRINQGIDLSNLRHISFGVNPRNAPLRRKILTLIPSLRSLTGGGLILSWEDFCQCRLSHLVELRSVQFMGRPLGQFLALMLELKVCYLENGPHAAAVDGITTGDYHSNISTLYLNLFGFLQLGIWDNLSMSRLNELNLLGRVGATEDFPETTVTAISSMLLRSGAILQKLTLRDIPSRVAISFIESHPTIAELTICGSFSKYTYSGRFGALISCLTPVTQTHQDSNTLNAIAPSMAILNLELVVEQGTVPSPMLVFVEDICALVENRALTPLGSNIARLSSVKVQPGLRSRGYSIRNIFPAIHNRLAPLQEASGLVLKFLPPKV